MVSKKQVVEELNFITERLSTQVRTTAFGALVFAWGLLIGDSRAAHSVSGLWNSSRSSRRVSNLDYVF